MSEELAKLGIYTAIPRMMADIGAVSKDRKNEQQKYSFRGIEDFYKAAHPAMVKHGVFCVPEVLSHEFNEHEKEAFFDGKAKITIWRHVTIKVRHRFYAADGSYVDVVTMGEGLDNSDKATNKAMSGAMKYALIELFSVPTQDVEDADRTTPEIPKATVKIGKKPEPAVKAEPAAPAAPVNGGATLTLDQQKSLHIFADSDLGLGKRDFKAWLKSQGYVGDDGEGTTKTILAADLQNIRRRLELFVRGEQ